MGQGVQLRLLWKCCDQGVPLSVAPALMPGPTQDCSWGIAHGQTLVSHTCMIQASHKDMCLLQLTIACLLLLLSLAWVLTSSPWPCSSRMSLSNISTGQVSCQVACCNPNVTTATNVSVHKACIIWQRQTLLPWISSCSWDVPLSTQSQTRQARVPKEMAHCFVFRRRHHGTAQPDGRPRHAQKTL